MNMRVLAFHDDRGVLTIELNRPEVRNALLPDMLGRVADVLGENRKNPSVRVVVLAGAGASFCAGGDANAMPGDFHTAWNALTRLMMEFREYPKPIIARVQGHAIGIGCSLALASDFVVAESGARFEWPFVKMGLVPEATQMALRCMPASMLRTFALLGEPMTGKVLAEAKVIHAAVDPGHLATAVEELIERLLSLPDFGIAAIKQSLETASTLPLQDSLQWEGQRQLEIRSSPEFSAFRKKYFERAGVKTKDAK
ncbi:MAG: enoyl-CoA hydratase/isomerase family protein [Gammaproteobacteria bacterium]